MRRTGIIVIVTAVALVVTLVILKSAKKDQGALLIVTGRVEADEVVVSTEIPGRLVEVYISDGVEVKKGQPLARVDDSEIAIREEEILRRISTEEEALRAMERELQALKRSVEAEIKVAQETLRASQEALKEAEIVSERLHRQYQRFQRLREDGVIPQDRFEDLQKAYQVSLSRVAASEASVRKAEALLQKAETGRLRVEAYQRKIEAKKKGIKILHKQLDRIRLRRKKTFIKAPVDGIILRKIAEPGEFLPSGGPVGVIIEPSSIHVKTFLPEKYLGRFNLNQVVQVLTDAHPQKPIEGYICYISDRAEFTPKEIDTSEERVKQVFETKICFHKPPRMLKKGMPVDVIFSP